MYNQAGCTSRYIYLQCGEGEIERVEKVEEGWRIICKITLIASFRALPLSPEVKLIPIFPCFAIQLLWCILRSQKTVNGKIINFTMAF